jgi:hypothetical protein
MNKISFSVWMMCVCVCVCGSDNADSVGGRSSVAQFWFQVLRYLIF